MKILRIQADGLPLFKETLDISFTTSQRFSNDDKDILFHLFPMYTLILQQQL